jgi:hypothetical protein
MYLATIKLKTYIKDIEIIWKKAKEKEKTFLKRCKTKII